MWSKPRVLSAMAIVAFTVLPVAAQEKDAAADKKRQDAELKELRDGVGRAERHVAVKQAMVTVAETRIEIAIARVGVLKSVLATAKDSEAMAQAKLRRLMKSAKRSAGELIQEAEASVFAAVGRRREAEANVSVGEAEVKHETARRGVAIAEYEEARFHLKTLQGG